MPMVQTRHARLSSLVCDGSNERGKDVVGVAAHYLCSRQLESKGTPKKPTLISYARARLNRHTLFVALNLHVFERHTHTSITNGGHGN